MSNLSARSGLRCEQLEPRDLFDATAVLAGGVLTVAGTAGADNRLRIVADADLLRVFDGTVEVAAFASASVSSIAVASGGVNDTVIIDDAVTQAATLTGGTGRNKLVGGGGATALSGGLGRDSLFGAVGPTAFDGGAGDNQLFGVGPADTVVPRPGDRILFDIPPPLPEKPALLETPEIEAILRRAAAASASSDAIIVIVDRGGRILGVRVESGVDAALVADPAALAFAIDGALSLARTGALFANDAAPLTSRTVRFISQSTITEREVNSNPNITDPNSTVRGPGYIAPVGAAGHFPPNIANTPQVDLAQIEHTNRDGAYAPGPDRIKGTADDMPLARRFNLDANFMAGEALAFLDGYGATTGTGGRTANGVPISQNRGIATLPGGVPIYKNGQLVGGIGVFFPGRTGYATESNSELSSTFDPSKADRTLEAEWIAFAAVGGTSISVNNAPLTRIGELGGVALSPDFGLPSGRIDLVGIQLDIFGRGGLQEGVQRVLDVGNAVGRGSPDDGTNQRVDTTGITVTEGRSVPSGWLVTAHDGDGITKAEVERIIQQGREQAPKTRAAIRLPIGARAKFVYAVADRQGNIVGLFRDPDATVFSIDVAVAKARNVAYYANAAQLQELDRVEGVPAGTALTNRTFRYLGQPRFPEGIDGAPPGPFSQFNDGGADRFTGRQVGAPLPASAYTSVIGYDSFNPGTNFRDPFNLRNQNGIVFFPGSAPLYGAGDTLIGGYGVSGDGVDQDDVTTVAGQFGFDVPAGVLRADQTFVRGVRLPYQKFNRNPEG